MRESESESEKERKRKQQNQHTWRVEWTNNTNNGTARVLFTHEMRVK